MWDWNDDGEYDMQDAFIDYYIYKSISDDKQKNRRKRDNGDVITIVAVGLLILGILILLA